MPLLQPSNCQLHSRQSADDCDNERGSDDHNDVDNCCDYDIDGSHGRHAAVVGSLLFLALVALVVFLVRRRKSAAVVARASQSSQLRSANEYQAVRVNHPSAAYDVGQIERPPEDDYSHIQINPPSSSNYGAVNAEEPRYADSSILAPDSGPATRGIVAADTGVGTNYGRL